MKTEISDFCKEYSSALIPAGAALDAVIEQIERDSQEDVLRLNLAGLNEVKHRLKSLIDKVEGQQAYLLIFGPLKSGKSTLMNAISGAYVSEVTSLPAYPCLVYVRHGDKPSIKLTRYNGRETATEDKNVMEVLINDHIQIWRTVLGRSKKPDESLIRASITRRRSAASTLISPLTS